MDFNWRTMLSSAAPILGTLVGGPFGTAIGSAVAGILGVADPADDKSMVLALASATPEQKAALLKLDQDYRLEMERLRLEGERLQVDSATASDSGQVGLLQTDAASGDWFRTYPRPAVMWISVLGMAVQYLALPLIAVAVSLWSPGRTIPKMDGTDLMFLTSGLLGLGGMRTVEKLKGVGK